MSDDFYSISLSRLRNMVLPYAADKGDVTLMAECAKIEALLSIAESLKTLAFHVKKWEEARRGF